MVIIQIIPYLPPAISGVGDYALNLAYQLHKDFDITTHFVVGDPNWQGSTHLEGFSISQVTKHSDAILLSLLPSNQATVLLHYVGYGYARRGCPFWLVEGLQQWCASGINKCLVTMFHEVYASGLPWTSAFWLSPLQRKLAACLTQISTHCFTSKQSYAEILNTFSRSKNISVTTLPIFSTIGEPTQILPLAERSKRLVIFGSRGKRLRVYKECQEQLSKACQLLEVEEIWDIGQPTGLALSPVNNLTIVEKGQQPAKQISCILLNSAAGLLDNNPNFLAKSTIFAAYCAHGVLPIICRGSALPTDGIELGKHYWVVDHRERELPNKIDLQQITNNAYSWYQTHNLSLQANIYATHLKNQSSQ
ncbi:MAG: glycosyltransferase family 1 protein [Coleofasciculus sp. B1-GNL1-01]|uniref:glycosyltransferase family 1 protein n=1 Tax=Coleofasciculus sp. B1-GNL1-01 TaxID=3068484 RepID=UPI0032F3686C